MNIKYIQALKRIISKLEGIREEELTTAEKQIKFIATKALETKKDKS